MLDSRSLYFSRIDRFTDQHEAAISQPTLTRVIDQVFEDVRAIEKESGQVPLSDGLIYEIALDIQAQATNTDLVSVFANCWHKGNVESGVMWAGYGTQGVAIQSTAGQLAASVKSFEPEVTIDNVTYVDHGSDDIHEHFTFLFKHRMYRHEEEVRAWVFVEPDNSETGPPHLSVPCELETLVNGVRLAPGAGSLQRVVQSLLKKYDMPQVPVKLSKADIIPRWRRELEIRRIQAQRRGR